MAEKRLSEELRHCLEDDACGDCQYHKPETKFICKGLLQKAYEAVKRHEEMFPYKVWDIVYNLVPKVRKSTYREDVISKIVFDEDSVKIYFQNGLSKDIRQIGKTVFLTKSAAEKALKEMEDRKNGEIDKIFK